LHCKTSGPSKPTSEWSRISPSSDHFLVRISSLAAAAPIVVSEEGHEGPVEEVFIYYTSSLQVPGALHILHNLTNDVLGNMEHFKEAQTDMNIVSKALTNFMWRDALLATCFNDGLAKFHAWRFKDCKTKIIDWR